MKHVRIESRSSLLVVTLDRPKALHALDLDMVRALHGAVERAAADDAVRAVVVRGGAEGLKTPAFCAGGDVRSVVLDLRARADGASDGALAATFFPEEYAMNLAIAHLATVKPWIALVDGIVMGGGAGISVHGSHRVATERTLFAMPETAIGFFPDVGATHFLTRADGAGRDEVGTWLALTGARIDGHAMRDAGLATHVVPSATLDGIVDELAHALDGAPRTEGAHEIVGRVLAGHALPPGQPTLAREVIARCFGHDDVREVVGALEWEQAPFAQTALTALGAASPTSLVATLALLRAARGRTLAEALAAELRAARAFCGLDASGARDAAYDLSHDFIEGVRAVLIDKTKDARWAPPSLAALGTLDGAGAKHVRAAVLGP